MLRRNVLAPASLLLICSAADASVLEPLVFLGDRTLPPYEFLEDNEPRGANVDLARAIGRVLGRPVEIRLMDWADAQARLRAGEGHALTMLGRTDEREATHDFTQPTFPVIFAIFVRADEAERFAAGTRLEGRRVGATQGGFPRQHISANHPEATLLLVDDLVQGTRKLLRGEIDALAANAWAERHLLRDLNVTGVAELPAFARRTGNIAVRKGESALLAEIDRALSALKASGEFDAIIDRWSSVRVHLLPDWVVRSAAAGGAAALLGLAALGVVSWRLSAGKRALANEVVERARAEEALRASEARLALASAAAGMGVWDWDAEAGTAVVNAEFRALYGLAAGGAPVSFREVIGRVHPEDRERVLLVSRAALSDGGEYRDEFRIKRADTGEERWVASRGRGVEVGPRPRRLIGVSYDVTERRAAQERQTLLAREVDHRAKNVLAVVSSIVRLTRAEDPREFAQAVEGRVAALARAHTLLASDLWTGAGLAESVRAELDAYEGSGRVMVQGPPLRLQPEFVQPVSMVLHELATNAAKYGAFSLPGGRVEVSWHLDGQGSDGDRPATMLRLTWTERGGPSLLGPPERRGFGSTVIEATVTSQLGGAAEMHWDVEGLRCEIAVPADRVLVATAPGGKHEAEVPRASYAATDPASVSLRGRRVLVVEDEQLVALELAATLAELGCEVLGPAGTLEEGLRLTVAQAGRLDAAVLDINLQGRASFPVADALSVFGVPVVYVTGYGSMPSGRSADASPLLGKPLRPGQLAAALRRVLASREAAASPPSERVSAERRHDLDKRDGA